MRKEEKMFIHIVTWKLKENAEGRSKEENIRLILGKINTLPAIIPQVKSLKAGADVLHTPTSYDFGLVGEFENQADFLIYRDHPEHIKVAQLISNLTTDRVSLDFVV